MDIGKALGYVFEDEEWVTKLLLGTVILLIPIFGWFVVMGYAIAVTRNCMAGESRPLPAWQDIGRFFMDGLMFWIVMMIYSIPLFIVLCPIALVWILPVLGGEEEDLVAILAGVSGLVTLGLGCLGGLYGILMGVLMPVLQVRYAETSEIGACLRFGGIFQFLFSDIGNIIISQVVVWLASIVVGLVVSTAAGFLAVIPICGWILGGALGLLMLPFSVWLMIFSGHLYGQIGRRAGTQPLEAQ
jgi:hypothetical protein